MYFDDEWNDNFLLDVLGGDFQYDDNILNAAKFMSALRGFISTNFIKGDDVINSNNNFQPYCGIEIVSKGGTHKFETCTPESMVASFHLTYQFPIHSFRRLMEYYASFSDDSKNEEITSASVSFNVPENYVILSSVLLNAEQFYYPSIFVYPKFSRLWNTESKGQLLLYMNELYECKIKDRQAEGLFYMVLSYALVLFNLSDDKAKNKAVYSNLGYGPKQRLPLMSRVSFSEMFDGLYPNEQNKFKALVKRLCSVPPSVDASGSQNHTLCDEMLLIQYGVMDGFNFDVKIQKEKPLSLTEWFDSIVDSNSRVKNQPKLVSHDPRTTDSTKMEDMEDLASDKLSPPYCYTRFTDKKYDDNDNSLLKESRVKAIYSMGAYTIKKPGYAMFELINYTSLDLKVKDMMNFIESDAVQLIDVLNGEWSAPSHDSKLTGDHITNIGGNLMSGRAESSLFNMNDHIMANSLFTGYTINNNSMNPHKHEQKNNRFDELMIHPSDHPMNNLILI